MFASTQFQDSILRHSAATRLLLLLLLVMAVVVQVDDMLAQAQSVSRSLLEQRRIFSNVQDKLVTVGERFPVINGLLNAVRRKKSKVRQLSEMSCSLLWLMV
jgi:Golgi SNAP receptor complex protein 1